MENVNDQTFDPNEIQICKPFSTVNNRIEYFLKRKREECHDRTTRLYCNPVFRGHIFNSSRTCNTIAVKRQKGSECFVKKSKAHNVSGPLCNGGFDPASENSYKLSIGTSFNGPNSDIHERITNLETCLNIKSEDQSIDIYEKLKSIEDRVLKLENMLLNKNENYSLSNYQETELINCNNLNTNHTSIQNNLITNNCLKNENTNSTELKICPTTSKYTADEIQHFINIIKRTNKN